MSSTKQRGDSRISIQQRIDEIGVEEAANYEREKAAHEEYLRLLEIWQKSPPNQIGE